MSGKAQPPLLPPCSRQLEVSGMGISPQGGMQRGTVQPGPCNTSVDGCFGGQGIECDRCIMKPRGHSRESGAFALVRQGWVLCT